MIKIIKDIFIKQYLECLGSYQSWDIKYNQEYNINLTTFKKLEKKYIINNSEVKVDTDIVNNLLVQKIGVIYNEIEDADKSLRIDKKTALNAKINLIKNSAKLLEYVDKNNIQNKSIEIGKDIDFKDVDDKMIMDGMNDNN